MSLLAGGQGPSIALPGTTGAQRGCSATPHPEHGWRLSSRGRECLSEQCRRLPGKGSGRRQAVRCRLPTPPGSTHLTHGGVTPRANAKLLRLLVLKTVPCSCLHSFPSLQIETAVCELLNSLPSVACLTPGPGRRRRPRGPGWGALRAAGHPQKMALPSGKSTLTDAASQYKALGSSVALTEPWAPLLPDPSSGPTSEADLKPGDQPGPSTRRGWLCGVITRPWGSGGTSGHPAVALRWGTEGRMNEEQLPSPLATRHAAPPFSGCRAVPGAQVSILGAH